MGVLAPWRPRVRAYAPMGDPLGAPEPVFIPLALVGPMELQPAEFQTSWRTPAPGEEKLPYASQLMVNEVLFLQFWAELPSPESVKAYKSFVDAYVTEQKRHGRFPHPLNNRVTPILDLMAELKVVPPQTKALAVISLLFLVVAALGIVGLTSFSVAERQRQIGTRRALGADRLAIVRHFLLENWMVTSFGVVLGVLLAYGLNFGIVTWVAGAKLSPATVAAGAVALWTIGLGAALGPALRGARVPPAIATRNV